MCLEIRSTRPALQELVDRLANHGGFRSPVGTRPRLKSTVLILLKVDLCPTHDVGQYTSAAPLNPSWCIGAADTCQGVSPIRASHSDQMVTRLLDQVRPSDVPASKVGNPAVATGHAMTSLRCSLTRIGEVVDGVAQCCRARTNRRRSGSASNFQGGLLGLRIPLSFHDARDDLLRRRWYVDQLHLQSRCSRVLEQPPEGKCTGEVDAPQAIEVND